MSDWELYESEREELRRIAICLDEEETDEDDDNDEDEDDE